MKLRLIRHATLWLEYGGLRILADPMLSAAGVNPPIRNSSNDRRNPLVPLPVPAEKLLAADVVLVTHLHADHWDPEADRMLDRSLPILCQPGDEDKLREQGFEDARGVEADTVFRGVSFHRTGGRHGTGEIGERMGKVSGFVLRAEGEPTLYLAGDTIYCPDVEEALARFLPDWTVVNAGGARFTVGDPITMTPDDVASVCGSLKETKVVAVHMDAINHCLVTRGDLRREMERRGLGERVVIPEDGEWVS